MSQSQMLKPWLPEEADGWKPAAGDEYYNRKNLYDYINGGAELYLSYGFNQLVSRIYSKPDQPDIIVDLFDMGTSENAYGVFSYSVETTDQSLGQGCQQTEGALLFWKDRYLVSILAWPETKESKEAVFKLAKIIEAGIPDEGPLPEILSFLPREALKEESIRYFRHHVWLNSHYFISDENILHIDETTNALLAKYGGRYNRSILLLVQYQNEKEARSGYVDFAQYYLPELKDSDTLQIEDGTWNACRLNGNLLAIVFNAQDEHAALTLLEEVQKRRIPD
ncbi:MAG: DUF6599 family protein [Spirochaetota bacterium]